MTKSLIFLPAFLLLLASCAHRPMSYSTTDRMEDMSANDNQPDDEEDREIKKLPTPKSDFGANGILMDAIPIEVNGEVEKWLEYFQGRGRGHFERYLERSTRYIPLMRKILRENGVPEDLVYIAMIESGFTGKIKSRARAVGYWQFISGTGKHYGLKANRWMDERWDPVRSTEAAAMYFKGLYNLFGNWFLAIASYNVGENRVKSLVMKNFTRDFWELARRKQLPQETTHYIPKFIAASLIAREPEKYGFTGLNYQAPMEFDTVVTKEPIDLRVLARSLNLDYDDLTALNPAWKTQYVITYGVDTVVRVPVGKGSMAKDLVADATVKGKRFLAQESEGAPDKISATRYKVKKGDTISSIADQFSVSEEELRKVNRIRKGREIRPGKSLRIPSSAFDLNSKSKNASARADKKSPKVKSTKKENTYTVKAGDTLLSIARRYNVSLKAISKENRMAQNAKVQKGQRLNIPD